MSTTPSRKPHFPEFAEFHQGGSVHHAVALRNQVALYALNNGLKCSTAHYAQLTYHDATIFIGNLPRNVDVSTVRKALAVEFVKFAADDTFWVIVTKSRYDANVIAFIVYRDRSYAERAMKESSGKSVLGRPIRVEWTRGTVNPAAKSAGNDHFLDMSGTRLDIPQVFDALGVQYSNDDPHFLLLTALTLTARDAVLEWVQRQYDAQVLYISEVDKNSFACRRTSDGRNVLFKVALPYEAQSAQELEHGGTWVVRFLTTVSHSKICESWNTAMFFNASMYPFRKPVPFAAPTFVPRKQGSASAAEKTIAMQLTTHPTRWNVPQTPWLGNAIMPATANVGGYYMMPDASYPTFYTTNWAVPQAMEYGQAGSSAGFFSPPTNEAGSSAEETPQVSSPETLRQSQTPVVARTPIYIASTRLEEQPPAIVTTPVCNDQGGVRVQRPPVRVLTPPSTNPRASHRHTVSEPNSPTF
ncbi:hypothetical protein K402DRAFT_424250 [Aulographum hederae CBS 113979]|uniref:RRM domain-containing protein n=1 Tax=Aulographum hederae CBS 113979 TaxID=1176131 RepID=A0A6G1GPY2_9PEZI|nr:hypothetical protein K402DRAFT_424250 [Aulographum hederae CBS 113979]